jgi:hypothetical protein
MDAAGSGNGAQLRCLSSFAPWYRPQSTSTRDPPASTRNRLPVTVPVPPRKVSAGSVDSRRSVTAIFEIDLLSDPRR